MNKEYSTPVPSVDPLPGTRQDAYLFTPSPSNGEGRGEVARPVTPAPPRRRGAPKGNRNACKHGFYSKKNAEANRRILKENTDLGRADREVFLAAWQINAVKLRDPSNQRLHRLAVGRFFDAVQWRYGITDPTDIEAMSKAFDLADAELALPEEVKEALLKQLV